MYYIFLYFLIGAIVAVWTAINQLQLESESSEERRTVDVLGAYLLIALAWPVSIVAFVYTLFAVMIAGGEGGGD